MAEPGVDKRKPPGTLPPPGYPPIRLSPLQASPVRASPTDWFEAPFAIRNDFGRLGYIPLEIRISEKDNEEPSGVTMRGRLWRSVPSWWLIPTLLCTLLVGGCSVPDSMGVRSGADPRHQDDNVRFRSTYYFRVFDVCRDAAGRAASSGAPPARLPHDRQTVLCCPGAIVHHLHQTFRRHLSFVTSYYPV